MRLRCFLFRAIMCGKEIRLTVAGYKRLKTEEVESDLKKKFGKDALRPVGDLDRPFTPGEFREFAGLPLFSWECQPKQGGFPRISTNSSEWMARLYSPSALNHLFPMFFYSSGT